MIGCITAISPCVKSASAELFPDLPHTMSALSGEERTFDATAQVERARDGAAAALTVARTRGVAMPLSSHGLGLISLRAARACACAAPRAAPALRETFGLLPGVRLYPHKALPPYAYGAEFISAYLLSWYFVFRVL
jgi:hypothetical protein